MDAGWGGGAVPVLVGFFFFCLWWNQFSVLLFRCPLWERDECVLLFARFVVVCGLFAKAFFLRTMLKDGMSPVGSVKLRKL